jgi:hypothetical protein
MAKPSPSKVSDAGSGTATSDGSSSAKSLPLAAVFRSTMEIVTQLSTLEWKLPVKCSHVAVAPDTESTPSVVGPMPMLNCRSAGEGSV